MANTTIPNLMAAIAVTGADLIEIAQLTGQSPPSYASFRATLQQVANLALLSLSLQSTSSYANDAAAAVGGVPIGGFYRNGSVVQIRVA